MINECYMQPSEDDDDPRDALKRDELNELRWCVAWRLYTNVSTCIETALVVWHELLHNCAQMYWDDRPKVTISVIDNLCLL